MLLLALQLKNSVEIGSVFFLYCVFLPSLSHSFICFSSVGKLFLPLSSLIYIDELDPTTICSVHSPIFLSALSRSKKLNVCCTSWMLNVEHPVFIAVPSWSESAEEEGRPPSSPCPHWGQLICTAIIPIWAYGSGWFRKKKKKKINKQTHKHNTTKAHTHKTLASQIQGYQGFRQGWDHPVYRWDETALAQPDYQFVHCHPGWILLNF